MKNVTHLPALKNTNQLLLSNPSYSFKMLICQKTNPYLLGTFVANSFVNLYFEPNFLDLYEEDPFFEREAIFSVKKYNIFISNVQPDYSRFVNCINNSLHNKYFVIAHWDHYYLPGSNLFHKKHWDEEHMICRINLDKKEILALSTAFGIMRHYTISFDDYFGSNLTFSESQNVYQFVRFNSQNSSQLNTKKIKNDLDDYLHSSCRFFCKKDSNRKFGLNAIRCYMELIESLLSPKRTDIIIQTRVICDHILSTMIRLNKLSSSNLIDSRLSNSYCQMDAFRHSISQLSNKIQMDYLESHKKKLINVLSEFCDQEKGLLREVSSCLERYSEE